MYTIQDGWAITEFAGINGDGDEWFSSLVYNSTAQSLANMSVTTTTRTTTLYLYNTIITC